MRDVCSCDGLIMRIGQRYCSWTDRDWLTKSRDRVVLERDNGRVKSSVLVTQFTSN